MWKIRPCNLKKANEYVKLNHRHNGPVTGQRFSLQLVDDDGTVHGVAICGNPVARLLDDGLTLEIRRVCTDGSRNACSMLYSACVRTARGMGYDRVITYTLVSEPGASLRASNFTLVEECCGGGGWDRPNRHREPADGRYSLEQKQRWEYRL